MIILSSSDVDIRGWNSAHPAFSCKEILDSWHSKGDGEYWIDPEKSGNLLRVYFDMARYGGKWISLFIWDTSIFDLEQFLLEHADRGCSSFLYEDPCYVFNRNRKKTLERVWLSRACRFEHNRTVCASCLQFDSVIGPWKGQLTRHACMRGQNASCAGAVVSHSAE